MNALIINPNTTQSMTEKMLLAALDSAPPKLTVCATTSMRGPASIQGPEDGEASIPGLLDELDKGIEQSFDGYIIGCFDDTGLDECRERSGKPVLGIGEAAFHASILMGHRFSVVTTLSVSIPVIEANIKRYGLNQHCCRVRASEVPVLELEKPGSNARNIISNEIGKAIEQDGCGAIVLGCAGMAPLAAEYSQTHNIPVIDGVVAATQLLGATLSIQSSMQP